MQAKTKSRWRFDPDDLSVPAAIVIVLGFFLVVGCSIAFGGKDHIKWGGLTLGTAVIFGYFVHASGKFLRRPRFWILTGALLIMHLMAWIAILNHVERWSTLVQHHGF